MATGHEFGTRESRHIESVRQLRWRDVEESKRFDDCIALGAWGAEWHHRKTYASTYDYPPERLAYDIPLSCLTSRDTPNLFAAGRVADGDRLAGAAIRVMGTAFATGHAAGVAAAHRGYFKKEGLDVELKFFQAAQPIAVAIASPPPRPWWTSSTSMSTPPGRAQRRRRPSRRGLST